MRVRSRINEFMSEELLKDLDDISRDNSIPSNNMKVDYVTQVLDHHGFPKQVRIGPGTNRYSIKLDGYIFKIALDDAGKADNWMEFGLSKELQPFVTKTYECNGLICVAEYVSVMSKEDFVRHSNDIRRILSTISADYIIGDMGTVAKNFLNWGIRGNGDVVCLDFAYCYKIMGDEMRCGSQLNGEVCPGFLEYDENFSNKLKCPVCGREYLFTYIRDKKGKKFYTDKMKKESELISYRLPHDEISKIVADRFKESKSKEEEEMKENRKPVGVYTDEEIEALYEKEAEAFANIDLSSPRKRPEYEDEEDYYEEEPYLYEDEYVTPIIARKNELLEECRSVNEVCGLDPDAVEDADVEYPDESFLYDQNEYDDVEDEGALPIGVIPIINEDDIPDPTELIPPGVILDDVDGDGELEFVKVEPEKEETPEEEPQSEVRVVEEIEEVVEYDVVVTDEVVSETPEVKPVEYCVANEEPEVETVEQEVVEEVVVESKYKYDGKSLYEIFAEGFDEANSEDDEDDDDEESEYGSYGSGESNGYTEDDVEDDDDDDVTELNDITITDEMIAYAIKGESDLTVIDYESESKITIGDNNAFSEKVTVNVADATEPEEVKSSLRVLDEENEEITAPVDVDALRDELKDDEDYDEEYDKLLDQAKAESKMKGGKHGSYN